MSIFLPSNGSSCYESSECRHEFVRFGFFYRASDGSRHQRYRCKHCGKTCSDPTFTPSYRQRRRDLNPLIFGHLVSCITMRRSARLLKTNRKTVVRKFLILGRYSQEIIEASRSHFPTTKEVEFDDMETFEHTKLKPVSIIAMVESGSRRILGLEVAQMPAKGKLAKRSREKYGKRKDERRGARRALFSALKPHIAEEALVKSDQSPHYPNDVREYFPKARHQTYKGRRGCVVGQGELKAGGFDPLFTLNHTYAMFRDNIKRLSRKTWCTTKKIARLKLHLWMYAFYHNFELIPQIEELGARWPSLGPPLLLVA